MSQLSQTTQDEMEALIAQILPEIGRDIAAKYLQQTQAQREEAYNLQQSQMEQQAQAEYLQLSKIIRMEHQKAMEDQVRQLEHAKNQGGDGEMSQIQEEKYEKFKQGMKMSNIQEYVMNSEEMGHLQGQIQAQLQSRYDSWLESELLNFTKDCVYKGSLKYNKELTQAQKQIHQAVEESGLTLKSQVEAEKTQLAMLKSKSNVLLKKLIAEKDQLNKRYQTQSTQKQQIYEDLMMKYKYLEKEAIQSAGIHLRNSFEEPHKQYIKPQGDSQLFFQLISEESECNQQSPNQAQHYSVPQTHFQSYQMPYSRILDINVKKYTSGDTQSQNRQNRSLNQLSQYMPIKAEESKFQVQYKKELRKMSGKSKLSMFTKNLIVETIVSRGQQGFKFVSLR